MPIDKSNLLFVCNANDSDSISIGNRYADIYQLSPSQVVSINCSSNQVLTSYTQFQIQVQNQVWNLLSSHPNTKVIILGYNVPGGFIDGVDTISSTSRISRIKHTYSKKTPSALFSRQVVRRYGTVIQPNTITDQQIALICSRIDGPDFQFVNQWMNSIQKLRKFNQIFGKIFIDQFDIDSAMPTCISDIQNLGLKVVQTTNSTAIQDEIFPYVQQDCFYWGNGQPLTNDSFFRSTNTKRVFSYNADDISAITMKDQDSSTWVRASIKSGYVSAAGAMSDAGDDGDLEMCAYFNSLYQSCTLGQAMTFSMPYFDWTVAIFGDPLAVLCLPVTNAKKQVQSYDASVTNNLPFYVNNIFQDISKTLAADYLVQNMYFKQILDIVIQSKDILTSYYLAKPAYVLRSAVNSNSVPLVALKLWLSGYFKDKVMSDYTILINSPIPPTAQQYLVDNNINVSRLISDLITLPSTSDRIYPQGLWIASQRIIQQSFIRQYYHFSLEVFEDQSYSNASRLYTIDSEDDQTGWSIQSNKQDSLQYQDMPPQGISSEYNGLLLRYMPQSDKYIESGLLFFKLTPRSETNTYPPILWKDAVWT